VKRAVLSILLIVGLVGAASPAAVVTSQILDYEKGWLFLTTGDGFRVAPNVEVVNGPAATRRYARVTFDASGTVTKIEVSRTKLAPEGDLDAIHHFAVSLSPQVPNPELAAPPAMGRCGLTRAGKMVGLTITVQVPPTTGATDNVYMTSDQSGWNAQAYRLDRIDALHYRTTLKLLSGTQMHVLFDRGSSQSVQMGQNGIEQQAYLLCVGDEDAQAFRATVYRWGDEQNGQTQQIPTALPTPYNPAPFPNLPTPHPR
jgi:hypothetical protein